MANGGIFQGDRIMSEEAWKDCHDGIKEDADPEIWTTNFTKAGVTYYKCANIKNPTIMDLAF